MIWLGYRTERQELVQRTNLANGPAGARAVHTQTKTLFQIVLS